MAPIRAVLPTPTPPPPAPSELPPWSNTVHWLGTILTDSQKLAVLGRLRSTGQIPPDQKEWL